MNQVALVGNLTDDPQLKYTQSGAAIAGFTVAVSHRIKSNGRWQDVTDGLRYASIGSFGLRSLRRKPWPPSEM